MEEHFAPIQWMRDTYRTSRLELLLPLAGGLALAQFIAALFVLRSYHTPLWALCLVATLYASLTGFAFLYRLWANHQSGVASALKRLGFYRLFGPFVASFALYALIAPTPRLAVFFLLMSLPYFLVLGYLAHLFAHAPLPVRLPRLAFPAIALPTLQSPTSILRFFKRTPALSRS